MAPPLAEAAKYVDPEKEVPDAESALAGARDILAETVSDDADVRKTLREMLLREGVVVTKAAKEEDSVYSMYYDFRDATSSNSHFVWNTFDRVIVRQYSFPARNVIPFWESEMVLRAGRSFEKEKVENPFKIESVFF